jgi:glycerol-3-phosphate acyltransferase PlsY
MLWIIIAVVISYLIGSIPTAYILGKVLKGIDLRQFGSHNVGATNAFRVLGKGMGISVLIIDVVKGIIPVVIVADYIIAKNINVSNEMIRIILGLASVSGHNWTIFLNLKGGKGVAVTFGILIGLAIKYAGLGIIFGLVLGVWIISFLITRMVSVASLLSSLALPIFMFLFKQKPELIIMGAILFIFIVFRHRANIKRILEGKETRLKLTH